MVVYRSLYWEITGYCIRDAIVIAFGTVSGVGLDTQQFMELPMQNHNVHSQIHNLADLASEMLNRNIIIYE